MSFEYKIGGEILRKFINKEGSLQSLTFKSKIKNFVGRPLSFKKRVFALVINALKSYKLVETLIEKVKMEESLSIPIPYHSRVLMTHDLLFSKGIRGGGQWKRAIIKFQDQLRNELKSIPPEILPNESIALPRYVRVNTLLPNQEKLENLFSTKNLKCAGKLINTSDIDLLREERNENLYFSDKIIPNLLIFPRNSTKVLASLVEKGSLIFQDKASCLPAHILNPPPNSVVIDACAAPGNKTSFLAALMNNNGSIFAFDINKKRLAEMERNLKRWAVECVETKRQDFLRVKPSEYDRVEYILVDPSCSGSGLVYRVNQPNNECDSNELSKRLEKLSRFQVMVLKHALSFPSVRRVVYSTCSTHQEENEMVVKEALESYQDTFKLEFVLPEWEGRGMNEVFELGDHCLRATPERDRTIGFFVAVFIKK